MNLETLDMSRTGAISGLTADRRQKITQPTEKIKL
jgi:hypothetical protein